jgi:hypothetical protein
MKLLQVLRALAPRVELRPINGLTRDLRSAKMAFKYRRWRECRKVPPCAVPDADLAVFGRR